ncbi:MAG: cell division protein ZapA [Caulobacteraceae bacterium]|nr:cell division protein ZapA [Caulobacteraceae bacterium]
MAKVKLKVAGRTYDIGCEAGHEAQLRSLAEVVDAKVRQVPPKSASGESRRLLLAALMLAEELSNALARASAAEEAAAKLGIDLVNLEVQAGEIIAEAAKRIDGIGADWE